MKAIRLIRATSLLIFLIASCGGRESLNETQSTGDTEAASADDLAAKDALKKLQDELSAAKTALEELERQKQKSPADETIDEQIEQAKQRMEEAAAKEKALQEELERKKLELLPYELKFKFSQKCLEIDGGRLDDDARAIQMPCVQSNLQKFRILQKTGGALIQNVVTGKCLTAFQAGTGNGTPVTQAVCAENDTQFFEKVADGAGFFYLKNKGSTRCLQIETNQPTDRLGVELFDCLQNENQKLSLKQDPAP